MKKEGKLYKSIFKILAFLIIWLVLVVLIDFPIKNDAWCRLSAEIVPLISLILVTYIFARLDGFHNFIAYKDNKGSSAILGIIVGLVWILVPTLILFKTDNFTIVGKNKIDYLWVWIVAAFLNVIMQELLVRAYIYALLKRDHNRKIAVLITTVIFTLFHGGAIEAGFLAVINVISMNLFINCLYEYQRNIISPILAHGIWNILGSIFLDVVSLADDYPSLLRVVASDNTIFSGGAYKIEASILVTGMNFLLLFYFYKKKSKIEN